MSFLRKAVAALALLLALASLAAALLALGGRFSEWLDLLTHPAPFYLAGGLFALMLALFAPARGRPATMLCSLAAVTASAWLLAPEFLGAEPEPKAPANTQGQIKIIQFNAWGGNQQTDAVADWLVSQNPDLIVTQEALHIREALKANGYVVTCPNCGAVIYSKATPIETYRAPAIPGDTSYASGATFGDARGEFTVVGVHRYWPNRFRKARIQTDLLTSYIATQPRARLILAGDFNSTPWSFARRREDVGLGLIRRTRAMPTWPAAQVSHNRLPAPFPYLPIDHVYAGAAWATVKVERGPRLGSDHYPVIVTLAPVDSVGS